MSRAILVHPSFDHNWPFVADAMQAIWSGSPAATFLRTSPEDDSCAHRLLADPAAIRQLALFRVPLRPCCIEAMTGLREVALSPRSDDPVASLLEEAGIRRIWQQSEGYWGQSVAEFGLALTLCGLRRIPQTHHRILTDQEDWHYAQPDRIGRPGMRGIQFGDDARFTHGTLSGKRVRIVGAGNIGSRYASFCHFLGADVAVWDPFAPEPAFHRAGARREHHLDQLVRDAEIFAPMLPLTDKTKGIVTAELIDALPQGCLVVQVTRARICDTGRLYARIEKDELSLAADVFDEEPLPLDHPLLGRDNVVHTPHNAGRTRDANFAFAQALADQFQPHP